MPNLLHLKPTHVELSVLDVIPAEELAGKRGTRNDLVRHQSSTCNCVYAYCSAGFTESTSDLVYSGHSVIAENGQILQQNAGIVASDYMIVQDCDLGKVNADRQKNGAFRYAAACYGSREYLIEPMRGNTQLRSDGALDFRLTSMSLEFDYHGR